MGRPVVPPVYMSTTGMVLLGLGGELGRRGPHEFLVGDVVAHVARADEDNLFDPRLLAVPRRPSPRRRGSVKHTFVPESARMYVESPRRESQVERVDHTTAKERCVPQLQIDKAVQGKHRVPIVRCERSCVRIACVKRRDPLEVLSVGAATRRRPRSRLGREQRSNDREKPLPVHEFLHRGPLPSSGATDALSPSCWSPC